MSASVIDFSCIASRYDQSGMVPEEIITKAIGYIEEIGIINNNCSVLDAGCGTGLFAESFSRLGYDTTGVDISGDTIDIAKKKSTTGVNYIINDVTNLEFQPNIFDICISSKLLLHIIDWRKAADEIIRVLKSEGCFIYCNEMGLYSNKVRQNFRLLADSFGYKNRFLGELNLEVIRKYIENLGCSYYHIDKRELTWQRTITYKEAFEELENKVFSEFWMIPDGVYNSMLDKTSLWINSLPDQWNTVEVMTPGLNVDVYIIK